MGVDKLGTRPSLVTATSSERVLRRLMKKMTAWLWVIAFSWAIACVHAEPTKPAGSGREAASLVGEWFEYFSPDFSSTHTFFADGKYAGVIEIAPRLKQPNVTFEGTWKIEDGHLVYTITQASDPEILRRHPVVRDKFLTLTDHSFTYSCGTTGEMRRMTRLPPKKASPASP